MTEFKEIFTGTITEGGQLKLQNKDKFDSALARLSGKEVELTIDKRKNTRTLNENNYYWGVVLKILGDYLGYQPEEMHEICRSKFLRKWATGKVGTLPYSRSTATLDTIAFEEYLEAIRTWSATEFQCVIPLPNEVELDP